MIKQYVIVPKKPKMSPGKIASQAAHATFMALKKEHWILKNTWKNNGMCVIVLQCKDKQSLFDIQLYLNQWKIKNHLYVDEGYTEVEPLSATCLATGIISEDKEWMFEKFKLYK